nr:hypothetical protein [Clostridia bacterium]
MKTGYDFIFHGWHIQFNMLLRLCILGDNPQRSQALEMQDIQQYVSEGGEKMYLTVCQMMRYVRFKLKSFRKHEICKF